MAKKDDAEAPEGDGTDRPKALSLKEHPRAQQQIRTAKGWGGLLGFLVTAYLSHQAGVPAADLLFRALVGGIAGLLVARGIAVLVWRQLAIAEIEVARRKVVAKLLAEREAAGVGDPDTGTGR